MLQLMTLCMLMFGMSFVQAAESNLMTIPVTDRMEERGIGRSLYLLREDAGPLTQEEILKGNHHEAFVPSDRDFPNRGLLSSESWARFTLHNSSSETRNFFLESRYAFIDSITLFQKNEEGVFVGLTMGDTHSYQERPIDFRLPVFDLRVPPGDHTYYVRIKTQGTVMFSLFLWDPISFQSYNKQDTLILGLAYGCTLILLIYNAFLAVSFRSRTYAYYCCYLIIYVYTQFGLQATGVAWLGGSSGIWANNQGFLASVAASNILSCLFAASFLNAKNFMPRWARALQAVSALNLVICVLAVVGDYNTAARFLSSSTVLTSLVLISMGVTAGFRGFRPAIYYTLAWTALLTGNILLTLLFNGMFPMNILVQYGNLYGGVIEVAFISLALADRVTYLQNKSERTIKHLNDELTRHVQEVEALVADRTETIRTIVDNVKSGFFTMTRDMRMEGGFTRSCGKLLGCHLEAGVMVPDALKMDVGQAQMFRMAVDQVFADIMHDEVAIGQIPKTYRLDQRILSLEGSVVRDQSGQVKLILFTLMDITRLKRKQKEAFRSSVLLRIIRNMDAFRSFITYTRDGLEALLQADLVAERSRVNFILHTIKGNSLVFNLSPQARRIHEVEEKVEISHADVEQIIATFRSFLEANADVLNIVWGTENEEHFIIGQRSLEALQKQMESNLQDTTSRTHVQNWIQRVTAKTAGSLIGPLHDDVKRLSQRLQKKVRLTIVGGETKIVNEGEKDLVKNLMHLVRNALIHGIESNRSAVAKPPVGQIHLEFISEPHQLQVIVEDDGAGFPLDELRDSLLKKGVFTPEEARSASASAVIEKLAIGGTSTALHTSLYAGRGVGLAAVYQAIHHCQGHIELQNRSGQGTRFTIVVPRRDGVRTERLTG
ncbi:MAG TPA: 7TM diverse intracellular signaling domain-containing protein [Oligoflexus sp.]|uniref:7TM diverse intracellular signaling domain-containing protein n=1 Tax=Oligoflexus sp. TaxID=1971216 RepID=UPI002D516B38|nr:7TM diverse intracellular signaling domain-containing protein [Oligoflexus sp.]HYX32848.1 7TM diverse intracellular signaling domain-containing protein [Oligoflexus sp.]